MSEIKKMVKDGEVAVLISPGYGAGWSTWNLSEDNSKQMLFSPELAAAILAGSTPKEVETLAVSLFPDAYHGGAMYLEVEWVPVGKRFIVTEYDGAESLKHLEEVDWYIA